MQNEFGWTALGALIGAFVTGLFAWLVQRGKSESDQGIAVLEQWSKLNGALASRLAAVEKNFAAYREKVAEDFEELRTKHRAEMRVMRELNEGLQRMIAQNSQSTAHLIGPSPVPGDPAEEE